MTPTEGNGSKVISHHQRRGPIGFMRTRQHCRTATNRVVAKVLAEDERRENVEQTEIIRSICIQSLFNISSRSYFMHD